MKEYLLYVLYCCLLTTQKAGKKWFSLTLVFNLSAVYLCVCVLGCLFFLKKTGHESIGTSYKAKRDLADGELKIENNKEVMKGKSPDC